MATVAELSSPYENFLRPVLPTGIGVCSICHTFVTGDYDHCFQCNEAMFALPSTADAVSMIALSVRGEQLARDLRTYKDGPVNVRRGPRFGLAAVLWRSLDGHEQCLAALAGVDNFPIVTTVPSTRGRENSPLDSIVGKLVKVTRERFTPLLRPRPDDSGGRQFDANRFEVIGPIDSNTPILVIDDTFTTGSRVQCAAAALKQAGSGPVGVLCMGRHFNRDQSGEEFRQAANSYYRRSRERGWDWEQCCLCAPFEQ